MHEQLIVMITNKKNLKARISKKGKYHIAHIQMPQSMVKILISSLTTKIVVLVEVRNTYIFQFIRVLLTSNTLLSPLQSTAIQLS